VESAESNPLSRNTVEVRSFNVSSIASKIGIAQIICHKKKNVWRVSSFCLLRLDCPGKQENAYEKQAFDMPEKTDMPERVHLPEKIHFAENPFDHACSFFGILSEANFLLGALFRVFSYCTLASSSLPWLRSQ
jgi:hypothetical protein